MRLDVEGDAVIAASTRRDASRAALELRYRIGAPLGASEPGSLEHFLLERYLLFALRRGVLVRGQVYHSPYPVFAAELVDIDESLTAAAGLEIAGSPAVIHYSPGVDVEVFDPEPVA